MNGTAFRLRPLDARELQQQPHAEHAQQQLFGGSRAAAKLGLVPFFEVTHAGEAALGR